MKKLMLLLGLSLAVNSMAENCTKEARVDYLKNRDICLNLFKEATAPEKLPATGMFVLPSNVVKCFEDLKEYFPKYKPGGECEDFGKEKREKNFNEFTKACLGRSNMDNCEKLLDEKLISKGKSVDLVRNQFNGTLLMEAARRHDKKAFDFLLSKGADINRHDINGLNVIQISLSQNLRISEDKNINAMNEDLRKDQFEIIKTAIEKGLKVNEVKIDGYSDLNLAIENGASAETIDLLLKNGANPYIGFVIKSGQVSWTAMNKALASHNLIALKALLQNGFDFKKMKGYPVWNGVCSIIFENPDDNELISKFLNSSVFEETIKLLLENKMDPNEYIYSTNNSDGIFTPVHSVFSFLYDFGAPDAVIQAFIDAKVDLKNLMKDGEPYDLMISAIDKDDGKMISRIVQGKYNINGFLTGVKDGKITPLCYASMTKNKNEALKAILKKSPNPNQTCSAEDLSPDFTALMPAIVNGNVFAIKELIKRKANVNQNIIVYSESSKELRMSILELAENFGNQEIIDILIKAGAYAPFKGDFVQYCLNENITEKMIEDAIKGGADVNEVEAEDGWTPIHSVAQNGKNIKALNALIKAGAFVNAPTKNGMTPFLTAAANNKNPEILKMLIAAGADIEAKDEKNWNALDKAVANNSPAVVTMLLKTSLGDDLSAERRNFLMLVAVNNNPDDNVLIALYKAGFKADPENSWLDKPLHSAIQLKKGVNIIKTLIKGKAIVDDTAMRMARDLPMDSNDERKYRNEVIDILTKAKKRQ